MSYDRFNNEEKSEIVTVLVQYDLVTVTCPLEYRFNYCENPMQN